MRGASERGWAVSRKVNRQTCMEKRWNWFGNFKYLKKMGKDQRVWVRILVWWNKE